MSAIQMASPTNRLVTQWKPIKSFPDDAFDWTYHDFPSMNAITINSENKVIFWTIARMQEDSMYAFTYL